MRRGMLALMVVIALLATAGRGTVAQDDAGGLGTTAVGEPVTIYGGEGDEIAQATATEVIDPFEDYAEFSGPAEGQRYALVAFEIENAGERPYDFLNSNFYVLDSLGRSYGYSFVTRTEDSLDEFPELESLNMNAGESVAGAVVYRVPEDAALVQIYYSFYADVQHLYFLGNLADDAGAADTDDADPTEEVDTGDTGDDGEAADVSEEECAELEPWGEDTLDRLTTLAPVGDELSTLGDDSDPERIREIAAQLADAADEQRESDPPALVEEANEQIADALDLYAEVLETAADALEDGDQSGVADLLSDVGEANQLIADAGAVTGPLFTACGIG